MISVSANQTFRRGRPSVEQSAQVKGRLFEKAWQLLQESGFGGFTFDKLATYANVGKATIYSRFSSKYDFLEQMTEFKAREIRMNIERPAESKSFSLKFEIHCLRILDFLSSNEHVLLERLIDQLEEHRLHLPSSVRRAHYNRIVKDTEVFLNNLCNECGVHIHNLSFAAKFWLEAVTGHAAFCRKLMDGKDDNAIWGRQFSDAFFKAFVEENQLEQRAC